MPADVVADRIALEFGFYVRDAVDDRLAGLSDPKLPVVAGVAEKSSAAQAGLHAGDRILAVNGADVATLDAFRARLQDVYLRDPLKLRVDREGEPLVLTLPAAQTPSS
jgi:S1-C subfamily serine protease